MEICCPPHAHLTFLKRTCKGVPLVLNQLCYLWIGLEAFTSSKIFLVSFFFSFFFFILVLYVIAPRLGMCKYNFAY